MDKDANDPLFNDFDLEINEDVYAFLEKHIVKAIQDDESRKANFKEGMNIIKEVCYRMTEDEFYFIEGSKEIARQLFKAMKTNSTISSTDLVICLYEEENIDYIGILKMDYSTSFIHDIEHFDSKFKITIKKQDISLPGTGQKIQKCAFVKGNREVEGFDLIVLDNQINGKDLEDPIAQFFLKTFLNAELVMDNKVRTKILKKETENWIRTKAKEGEVAAEEVRQFINYAIREEEHVDIGEVSQKAFGNKQYLYEDYVSNMKDKGLVEEKFEVDKAWVERKLNKIRLKTESNIEVVLSYEDYNDRGKFEIISNGDGTRSIIIKNVVSIFEK
ncbi:MAG: nucleoid-associated protein [Clostridia bacterium]|nr:nucleoid-associated protein [Clostridia bacterium]